MRKKPYPLQKQKAPKFFIQTVHQYLNIRNDLTSREKNPYIYILASTKNLIYSVLTNSKHDKLDEKTSIE